jgi:tyrosyl-tRNA synthetase
MKPVSIEYLLKRAVAEVISEEELRKLLKSGRKLRIKEGLDPSAPDIHLGHMVGLRKMRQFQDLGHQIVIIVGDWTAQIGDPSGKSTTRKMLSAEEVKANAETYLEQFFKIVDKAKTEVRFQSEWFGKFDLADVVRLTSKFTVAQFLQREDFAKRFSAAQPIAITELLYPLLQAYDSVAIKADIEMGGTDQKFNFLVGRDLQALMGQPSQQIFMTPLLVGLDGVQKMSKSLGNYIGVAEEPETVYGKTMSIKDDFILPYFELLTDVPDEELADMKKQLESGINPMNLKKLLAKEILIQLYSAEETQEAQEHFEKTVQNKELPDEISQVVTAEYLEKIKVLTAEEQGGVSGSHWEGEPPEWSIPIHILLFDHKLAKSRSEANRLLSQGALSINGKRVNVSKNTEMGINIVRLKIGDVLKIGKRNYLKVVER